MSGRDELVLRTADATLGEAIQDGTIAWTYDVDWENLPAEAYGEAARGQGLALTAIGLGSGRSRPTRRGRSRPRASS